MLRNETLQNVIASNNISSFLGVPWVRNLGKAQLSSSVPPNVGWGHSCEPFNKELFWGIEHPRRPRLDVGCWLLEKFSSTQLLFLQKSWQVFLQQGTWDPRGAQHANIFQASPGICPFIAIHLIALCRYRVLLMKSGDNLALRKSIGTLFLIGSDVG